MAIPLQNPDNRRWSLAVWLIFVVCVSVELVLVAADLGLIGSGHWRRWAYEFGGFWGGLLKGWRPNFGIQPVVMFASYGFLHSGIVHLTVNMITLISLGAMVQRRIGDARLLLLYVSSLIGGGIGFAVLSSSAQPMIGASGALFGLAGALVAWEFFDRRAENREIWPVARIILLLAAINVVLWWAMDGLLAWQTHLGGFVAGGIVAKFVDSGSRSARR